MIRFLLYAWPALLPLLLLAVYALWRGKAGITRSMVLKTLIAAFFLAACGVLWMGLNAPAAPNAYQPTPHPSGAR